MAGAAASPGRGGPASTPPRPATRSPGMHHQPFQHGLTFAIVHPSGPELCSEPSPRRLPSGELRRRAAAGGAPASAPAAALSEQLPTDPPFLPRVAPQWQHRAPFARALRCSAHRRRFARDAATAAGSAPCGQRAPGVAPGGRRCLEAVRQERDAAVAELRQLQQQQRAAGAAEQQQQQQQQHAARGERVHTLRRRTPDEKLGVAVLPSLAIQEVTAGSPAERAGVRKDAVLVTIDGAAIGSVEDAIKAVNAAGMESVFVTRDPTVEEVAGNRIAALNQLLAHEREHGQRAVAQARAIARQDVRTVREQSALSEQEAHLRATVFAEEADARAGVAALAAEMVVEALWREVTAVRACLAAAKAQLAAAGGPRGTPGAPIRLPPRQAVPPPLQQPPQPRPQAPQPQQQQSPPGRPAPRAQPAAKAAVAAPAVANGSRSPPSAAAAAPPAPAAGAPTAAAPAASSTPRGQQPAGAPQPAPAPPPRAAPAAGEQRSGSGLLGWLRGGWFDDGSSSSGSSYSEDGSPPRRKPRSRPAAAAPDASPAAVPPPPQGAAGGDPAASPLHPGGDLAAYAAEAALEALAADLGDDAVAAAATRRSRSRVGRQQSRSPSLASVPALGASYRSLPGAPPPAVPDYPVGVYDTTPHRAYPSDLYHPQHQGGIGPI
eukprot:TRINITY_DN474_c0_g2_i1.p1 TRINITY_DN474_c0_g2~~TRINITY_DN474_c0_g2_i1.p1  ORF type:complete len:725 (+),score=205.41 TRINITY_DN474_c0_g2_i1:190-2175(+)